MRYTLPEKMTMGIETSHSMLCTNRVLGHFLTGEHSQVKVILLGAVGTEPVTDCHIYQEGYSPPTGVETSSAGLS